MVLTRVRPGKLIGREVVDRRPETGPEQPGPADGRTAECDEPADIESAGLDSRPTITTSW